MLEKELIKIITDGTQMQISEEDITTQSDLIADFGYDSISIIQLVVEIEKKLGVSIDNDYLLIDVISNYGRLLECVQKYSFPQQSSVVLPTEFLGFAPKDV